MSQLQQSGRRSSLLLSLLALEWSSTDWMSPSDIGRTMCFTQPTYSHVNLIQKHPHIHTRNNA